MRIFKKIVLYVSLFVAGWLVLCLLQPRAYIPWLSERADLRLSKRQSEVHLRQLAFLALEYRKNTGRNPATMQELADQVGVPEVFYFPSLFNHRNHPLDWKTNLPLIEKYGDYALRIIEDKLMITEKLDLWPDQSVAECVIDKDGRIIIVRKEK